MKCKGCEYLNWLESNQGNSIVSVTYVCIHPMARGVDKIVHGASGYLISREEMDNKDFLKKVGDVFQPVWCPLMDDGEYSDL